MLCLVIFGIKRYLNIALPHPIRLSKHGFTITHNSSGRIFPLYLHSLDTINKVKSLPNHSKQVFLENALFLLDQDIQFLNYVSGEQLVIGAEFESASDWHSSSSHSSESARGSLVRKNGSKDWWLDLVNPGIKLQSSDFLGTSQYSVAENPHHDKKFFLDLTPLIVALKDNKLGNTQGPLTFKISQKRLASKLIDKEHL